MDIGKFILFLLVIVSLGGDYKLLAQTMSTELHYRWVSDSTYEFTYVHFNHSNNQPVPPVFFNYKLSSQSLNYSISNLCSNCRVPNNTPQYSPFPTVKMNACSYFNIGAYPNYFFYQKYLYRFSITLPKRARDWIISIGYSQYTLGANLFFGADYTECGINNLDFTDSISQNISPLWSEWMSTIPNHLTDTFINPPIISTCIGRTYNLDQSASELDGDLIRYSIPKEGVFADTTTTFVFSNGFSLDYYLPSDTPPQFRIDSITGFVLFKPIIHQRSGSRWIKNTNIYAVPVMATEYRLDTFLVGGNLVIKRKKLGHVTRLLSFVVTPDSLCGDSAVLFADTTNHIETTSITLSCGENPFKIAFNNTIRCNTVDSNGSCFMLIHSLSGDTIDILKAEAECRLDNIADNVKIQTNSTLDTGQYFLFLKTGNDGNSIITECGSEIIIKDSLLVHRFINPEEPTLLKDSSGSEINSLETICRSRTINIYPSYPISCKSLRIDGSEFYLVDSTQNPPEVARIKKVIRGVCNNGFLEDFSLRLDNPIEPGNYKLYLVKGSDGNTLVDACHRKWPLLVTDVNVPSPELDIGPDYQFCSRDTFNVNLSLPKGINGQWSTGAYRNSISVNEFGTYWVKMFTSNGCFAIDTVHITELNCTGIEESLGVADFTIYPNPSIGQFTIEFGKTSSGLLSILGSIGKVVYSEKIQDAGKATITLPNSTAEGFYIVKFETAKGTYMERLVLRSE